MSETLTDAKTVAIGRGADWLFEGFAYFKKSIVHWIIATIIFYVLSIGLNIIPVIGALLDYVLLMVLMGGLMIGCQHQAQGDQFKVAHLFAGFSQSTKSLVILGVLYLIGILVVIIMIGVIIFLIPGSDQLINAVEDKNPDLVGEALTAVLLVILIAASLLMPLIMAFWFAPALVVFHDVTPLAAAKLSFLGCLKNILPFLIYGVVGIVLLFIALIPAGLGLLILTPMIFASIYIAYTEIFTGA